MEQGAAKCDSGRDDCDTYLMGIPKAWLQLCIDLFDRQHSSMFLTCVNTLYYLGSQPEHAILRLVAAVGQKPLLIKDTEKFTWYLVYKETPQFSESCTGISRLCMSMYQFTDCNTILSLWERQSFLQKCRIIIRLFIPGYQGGAPCDAASWYHFICPF